MVNCHEPHASWVESAVLNGIESVPDEQRTQLMQCAICSADLAALDSAQQALGGAAASFLDEEAEDLAMLGAELRPEDADFVRTVHERHLGGDAPPNGNRTPWFWIAPLAAAFLVAASVWFTSRDPQTDDHVADADPGRPETMLSTTKQGAVVTTRVVYDDSGLWIEWEPLDAARSYQVVVLDPGHDELKTDTPTRPEFHVPPTEAESWPDELTVEIVPLSVSRRAVGVVTVLAVPRSP